MSAPAICACVCMQAKATGYKKRHLNSFDLFCSAYVLLMRSIRMHAPILGNGLVVLFAMQVLEQELISNTIYIQRCALAVQLHLSVA